MMKLIVENNEAFLSYSYIQSFGIGYNTIKHWSERKVADVKYFEGKAFVRYQDIPAPTRRKKLPQESIIIKEFNDEAAALKVKSLLHQAFYYNATTFRHIYEKDSSLATDQITKFSRLHSVFQSILDLKGNEGFRQLTILQREFNDLFNQKYKTKQAFSQAILKAKVDGIMSVAMDKRTFGNNDRSKKASTPEVDYLMQSLIACNGKFSCPVMLEKANKYFKEKGLKQMSLSWIKKQRRLWLRNPEIYKSRYGAKEANKIMPYASMNHANLTHIQWQVDGWNMPFWEDKFHRSVLVIVIDNCSKKIIGYAIGNTENSEVIKAAIRNAVDNTGVLPFELVMDNHSFTKTKAAFNFESLLTKVGATLTKTSNPQHKAIIERYFQKIDLFCKEYAGWLGKNVRSKSIENFATDEQYAKYAKEFKSHSQVVAIATSVIDKYNSGTQKNLNNLSPNQSFINYQHPNPILLNQFHRATFLPNQQIKKISRNQITIMRGIEKFEYSLPAELFSTLNNEDVLVAYDDLNNGIYLFDMSNGEGIIFLRKKGKINNAKALQTDADINALYRNAGKIKGIKTQATRQLENTRNEALNIDPDAYLKVNALTTPKDIIKELQENSDLRCLVEANGVVINEMDSTEPTYELPASLKPENKSKSPFTANNNKIELIQPSIEPDNE